MFNPKDLHFTLHFSSDVLPAHIVQPLYTRNLLCELVRQTDEGVMRCRRSDKPAFQTACQTKRPYIYECHAGLTGGVIPILLGENSVAFLVFGQFLTEQPSEEKFREIWERIKDLSISYEEARKAFFKTPVVPFQYVESIAEGMFEVVQEIARQITERLLSSAPRRDSESIDAELWLAQQEWQILHIFKRERELLSLFHWASGRGIRKQWNDLITEEFEKKGEPLEKIKARIGGVIASMISHLRIFPSSSKIDVLKLAAHYNYLLEECESHTQFQETLNWIINDLIAIRGETSCRQSLVERAKEFICQNYGRENLSLRDIAKALHLSPYYLAHLFKTSEGITLGRYIREVRMARAKELLARGELSITDIALEVGYSNPAHFSYIFKKETGVSPSKYKKRHNKI